MPYSAPVAKERVEGTMKMISTLALAVAVMMVAACGKDVATPAQTGAGAPMIREIHVGSGEGGGAAQQLGPRSPVLVQVHGAGGDQTQLAAVEAKLIELKTGAVVGTATGSLHGGGDVLALKVPHDADLAPGRYLVEIRLDGRLAGSRDVDVFEATAGG